MVTARRLEAHRDTAATVPQPLAIVAVVVNDFANRTLFVKLPDHTTGAQRVAWQRGYEALQLWEETGRGDIPPLWARSSDSDRVARAVPGDMASLKLFFPPEPGSAYSKLIGRPGLYGIATVDRAFGYFVGLKLLHRP
jgi:hypothetical protein